MGAHRRHIRKRYAANASGRRGLARFTTADTASEGGGEESESFETSSLTSEGFLSESDAQSIQPYTSPTMRHIRSGWSESKEMDKQKNSTHAECKDNLFDQSSFDSSSQQEAAAALKQRLAVEAVNLRPLVGESSAYCPAENVDLALLRFARHNRWNVKQAYDQVMDNLSWRSSEDMAAIRRREPWQVAGCPDRETFDNLCRTYYPHYTIGTDRMGRPVLVQKYGNFNTAKVKECTTLKGMVMYHAWEQEKNAELLRRASRKTGRLAETYTLIMDFDGMGLGLVNTDFLWLLRALSDMDRRYYPGRGGATFVINTSPLFGLVWRGIRGFMEATQARIHIFGQDKEEWKCALREAIDPQKLPVEYGGNAPAFADTPFLPQVHKALDCDAGGVESSLDHSWLADFIGENVEARVSLPYPSGNSAGRCRCKRGSNGSMDGVTCAFGDGPCLAGDTTYQNIISSRYVRDRRSVVTILDVDREVDGTSSILGFIPGAGLAASAAGLVVDGVRGTVECVVGVAGGAIQGCVNAVVPERVRESVEEVLNVATFLGGWVAR